MRDPQATLNSVVFSITTGSVAETEALGEAWGKVLVAGDVLLLEGDLGAGKTTLVRGVARGLGISIGVKSPTFVLHLQYPGRLTLNHLDLYRIQDAADLPELGLDEVLSGDGVCVVEWGDRMGSTMPPDRIHVVFAEPSPGSRVLTVSGTRERVDRLARAAGTIPPSPGDRS